MQDEKSASYYRKKFIKTVAVVLLVGGGFFFKGSIENILLGKKDTRPSAVADKKGRKIKYWVGPMNPKFHSDKPGKSPMGMDLVPVYEDDEGGGIKIDSSVKQIIGVKTTVVKRKNLARDIRLAGLVTYDERTVTKIQSKTMGWIEKLYVDFTGEHVKKGDYLLEIYSPELVSTSEEYVLALDYYNAMSKSSLEAVKNSGRSLLEASRRRLEFFDVPEHQINELTKTHKVKKTLHIHSPVDGIVVTKNVEQGMQITPSKVLYVIADLSTIWVLADIYEYEIPWVKEGQEVKMTLTAIPDTTFKGVVTYIYPYLERKTRTVQVRMEFKNPNLLLKPDMYADVQIKADVRKNMIAITKEAVIRTGKADMVMVEIGEGRFEPREVRIGIESEDDYEITAGLKEGEKIVISGNFLLDSESNLKEIKGKMLPVKEETKSQPKKKMKGMDMKGKNPCGMKMGKMDHGKMKHSEGGK